MYTETINVQFRSDFNEATRDAPGMIANDHPSCTLSHGDQHDISCLDCPFLEWGHLICKNLLQVLDMFFLMFG